MGGTIYYVTSAWGNMMAMEITGMDEKISWYEHKTLYPLVLLMTMPHLQTKQQKENKRMLIKYRYQSVQSFLAHWNLQHLRTESAQHEWIAS